MSSNNLLPSSVTVDPKTYGDDSGNDNNTDEKEAMDRAEMGKIAQMLASRNNPPMPADVASEAGCPYVEMVTRGTDDKSEITNYARQSEEQKNEKDGYSIVSSILTADGIDDPIGFFIVCLVILIGDMSRGVMFPTLWPLVESLGGTEVTQGYAVAAFSFGRILVSPIFGGWSVTYGYTKTLLFSCSILFLGTLLYAQAENVGYPIFLIFAQTTLGVGSGTLGVTRAFVAEVTPKRNRTTYLAWLTAVQYSGFTVTPFIGALFARLFEENEDRVIRKGLFVLDAYTAPAYFMGVMCAITILLLLTLFQDRQRVETKKGGPKSKKRTEIDELANSRTICSLTVYDACILGCMLLNISTKGSIACFETLGITIADSYFGMNESEAGFIVSICGTIGVISLLSMGHIAKYLTDVQMIAYGMVVMIAGILSLGGVKEDMNNPSWRYLLSIFLVYAVGYPIGHTAVIGLFSKIVGRRPQGTLLGWFASAGSLSRMSFPIMSGYIVYYEGINTLLIILIVVLSFSTSTTIMNNNTLTKLST